eukprot:TRINITY_DN1955_c0_g5_i2.p1 TRINITY_DN1955_c0_g5~~TRINITY_DN1955_c0_g5_i2.p1  ORF type:complete len:604 (-),score=105.66 TRINITY_DN1955_c0_g5_i2:816-2627(-)
MADGLPPVPFVVEAWHPYTARTPNELSLRIGQVVTVSQVDQKGWFGSSMGVKTVWFPASHTKLFVAPSSKDSNTRDPSPTKLKSSPMPMKRSASANNVTASPPVPSVRRMNSSLSPSLTVNGTSPPGLKLKQSASASLIATLSRNYNLKDVNGQQQSGPTQSEPIIPEDLSIPSIVEVSPDKAFGMSLVTPRIDNPSPVVEEAPLTEDEIKAKAEKDLIQQKRIIQEIVETERDYIRDLNILLKNFKAPLIEKGLLPEDSIPQIFSNVEIIHGVNKSIVDALTDQINELRGGGEGKDDALSTPVLISLTNIDKLPVGNIFMRLAPFLKMYLQYCESHDNALTILSKHKKKKKELEMFDQEQSEKPECRGLYLKDYLIKPIQRLCKYPLLFQNLLDVTPKNAGDYEMIKTTVSKIDVIVRDINTMRDNNINFLTLYQYEEKLQDYSGTILSQTRKFVREGTIYISEVKRSKLHEAKRSDAIERVVLIFNDTIIICKKSFGIGSKTYQLLFRKEILAPELKVMDHFDKENPSLIIESHTDPKKSLVLYFSDVKEKNTWFKVFREVAGSAKKTFVEMEGTEEWELGALNAETVCVISLRYLTILDS